MPVGTSDGKFYEDEFEYLKETFGLAHLPTNTGQGGPITKNEPTYTPSQEEIDKISAGAAALPSELSAGMDRIQAIRNKNIADPSISQQVRDSPLAQGPFSESPLDQLVPSKKRLLELGTRYPSSVDLDIHKTSGMTYGDPIESYVKGTAKMKHLPTLDHVNQMYQKPELWAEGGAPRKMGAQDVDFIGRAWVASRRSPLSQLGFNMDKLTTTKTGRTNIGGFYVRDTDQMWSAQEDENRTAPVHESIHRGINMLRQAGKLPKDISPYEDELITRAVMSKYFGTAEAFEAGGMHKQIMEAKEKIKPKDIEQLEDIAAKFIADKRPMGPR